MGERFIGEAVTPLKERLDFSASAPGEPALPRAFRWRGETVELAAVLRRWKTASPCRHGSGERYVRRHWYEVSAADGRQFTIYFDRQPRTRSRLKRWWLFSLREGDAG